MTDEELVGQLHDTLPVAGATIEIATSAPDTQLTVGLYISGTKNLLLQFKTRSKNKRNDGAVHMCTPRNLPHKNTPHPSLISAVPTLNNEAHGMGHGVVPGGVLTWVQQLQATNHEQQERAHV